MNQCEIELWLQLLKNVFIVFGSRVLLFQVFSMVCLVRVNVLLCLCLCCSVIILLISVLVLLVRFLCCFLILFSVLLCVLSVLDVWFYLVIFLLVMLEVVQLFLYGLCSCIFFCCNVLIFFLSCCCCCVRCCIDGSLLLCVMCIFNQWCSSFMCVVCMFFMCLCLICIFCRQVLQIVCSFGFVLLNLVCIGDGRWVSGLSSILLVSVMLYILLSVKWVMLFCWFWCCGLQLLFIFECMFGYQIFWVLLGQCVLLWVEFSGNWFCSLCVVVMCIDCMIIGGMCMFLF